MWAERSSLVQIPLWTIVILSICASAVAASARSDSSMDDCNSDFAWCWHDEKECSDSSMDDCNGFVGNAIFAFQSVQIPLWTIVHIGPVIAAVNSRVQIPLWTIVTRACASFGLIVNCSDSSMDDCNSFVVSRQMPTRVVQIPLWTIVTQQSHFGCYRLTGSDSSMDEKQGFRGGLSERLIVQIPLWTIVIPKRLTKSKKSTTSRFLCGRL